MKYLARFSPFYLLKMMKKLFAWPMTPCMGWQRGSSLVALLYQNQIGMGGALTKEQGMQLGTDTPVIKTAMSGSLMWANLDRYPLFDQKSPKRLALEEDCKRQIKETGI